MAKKKQRKSSKKDKKKKKFKGRTVDSSETKKTSNENNLQTQVLSSDEYLKLSQAKTHWLFGEWDQLTALQYQEVENHPERDRLALLVASAHQQQNDHEEARQWGKWALTWGCPPKIVAKVFISSVHNTLGRISALKQDDKEARKHFHESISLVEATNTDLMSHTRSVREMAKMGLLPQAVSFIQDEQKSLKHQRPANQYAISSMLRTELELLQHELSLAQQRQQLYNTGRASKLPFENNNEILKEELKKKSVSQLGQDLWVLEQTGYKRNGFFVEFGATDGVLLSNTWLLEKEFGWDGICAEPNPKFFEKLQKNRRCTNSNSCISGETGKIVEFVYADAFGGVKEYIDTDHHGQKRDAYIDAGNVSFIESISLHDFLIQNNAPKDIDYISIDTEGSEYEILKAFPFDQWNIKLMTVEHNFTDMREKIRKLLNKQGYKHIEQKWDDWFYQTHCE